MRRFIWLHTCGCGLCKGRAAVCMAGFGWIDWENSLHALQHAREDMLKYFDRLPLSIKNALNASDVNVCSWCAEIWVNRYGAFKAAKLIRDVRFVRDDPCRAATPIDGW